MDAPWSGRGGQEELLGHECTMVWEWGEVQEELLGIHIYIIANTTTITLKRIFSQVFEPCCVH